MTTTLEPGIVPARATTPAGPLERAVDACLPLLDRERRAKLADALESGTDAAAAAPAADPPVSRPSALLRAACWLGLAEYPRDGLTTVGECLDRAVQAYEAEPWSVPHEVERVIPAADPAEVAAVVARIRAGLVDAYGDGAAPSAPAGAITERLPAGRAPGTTGEDTVTPGPAPGHGPTWLAGVMLAELAAQTDARGTTAGIAQWLAAGALLAAPEDPDVLAVRRCPVSRDVPDRVAAIMAPDGTGPSGGHWLVGLTRRQDAVIAHRRLAGRVLDAAVDSSDPVARAVLAERLLTGRAPEPSGAAWLGRALAVWLVGTWVVWLAYQQVAQPGLAAAVWRFGGAWDVATGCLLAAAWVIGFAGLGVVLGLAPDWVARRRPRHARPAYAGVIVLSWVAGCAVPALPGRTVILLDAGLGYSLDANLFVHILFGGCVLGGWLVGLSLDDVVFDGAVRRAESVRPDLSEWQAERALADAALAEADQFIRDGRAAGVPVELLLLARARQDRLREG